MLTKEQIDEILELCEKLEIGPQDWRDAAEKELLAVARTALPEFATEVIRLRAENAKLRAVAEASLLYIIAEVNNIRGDRSALFAELWRTLAAAGYGGEG